MAIDPELRPAIARSRAAWPVPGHELPLAVWRERYEALAEAARPPRPAGVTHEDRRVGACGVAVRVYRPDLPGARPVLVYFHGGGWVIGSMQSHDDITADIAHDTGCVVVSVDYSRAPEHRFPIAFGEGLEVLRWLDVQGSELGVDPERILVGGDSAGGNLAAAMALAVSERGGRLLGQALLYPCVDTDFTRPSYVEGRDAPFLTSAQMEWFWAQYAPSAAARADRFAVPMRAGDDALRRVAPAFIATAEHDPLHDEGVAYAVRLGRLGVVVQHEPGTGLVHGFVRMRHGFREPARIYAAMCGWIRARAGSRVDGEIPD
jgi:acetyl esterase